MSEVLANEDSQISTQDMYARRGYELYGRIEKCWSERDATGKNWYTVAAKMRKNVG